MTSTLEKYVIKGTPPQWSVAWVNAFLTGALQRIQRDGWDLPEKFWFTACPWGERNALGGTPEPVQDVVDPRFRLVHFTGCGRPYLVILFLGSDAQMRQQVAMEHLPWSEHFLVTCCSEEQMVFEYLGCTEEIWIDATVDSRSLRVLLNQGALTDF